MLAHYKRRCGESCPKPCSAPGIRDAPTCDAGQMGGAHDWHSDPLIQQEFLSSVQARLDHHFQSSAEQLQPLLLAYIFQGRFPTAMFRSVPSSSEVESMSLQDSMRTQMLFVGSLLSQRIPNVFFFVVL